MTVLEAVQKSGSIVFMYKSSINAAQKMLMPSEDVLWAVTGNVTLNGSKGTLKPDPKSTDNKEAGVTVLTTQRILFASSILGNNCSKAIQFSEIQSVEDAAMLHMACLRIMGMTSCIIIDGSKKTIEGLKTAINSALAKATANSSASLSNSDYIEQLQALKQLYDSGIITSEEFAAKKAQILNL